MITLPHNMLVLGLLLALLMYTSARRFDPPQILSEMSHVGFMMLARVPLSPLTLPYIALYIPVHGFTFRDRGTALLTQYCGPTQSQHGCRSSQYSTAWDR